MSSLVDSVAITVRDLIGPDLADAPFLDQQILWLDNLVHDPDGYAQVWLSQVDAIGSAYLVIEHDGSEKVRTGVFCDAQELERSRRITVIRDHALRHSMRPALIRLLTARGLVADNRANDPRATTKAIRDYLTTGGRILLTPQGEVTEVATLAPSDLAKSPDEREKASRAADAFHDVRLRFAARPQVARAVRMLGECTHNGWMALTARPTAAPLVAVPPVLSARLAADIGPVLAAALDRHRQARANLKAFSRDFFNPAMAGVRDAIAAVPHVEAATTFVNVMGKVTRLTTENLDHVAAARRVLADDGHPNRTNRDWLQAVREIVEADDARRARIEEIRQQFGTGELHEKDDALGSIALATMDAVIAAPATHLNDVLAKMDFIVAEDEINEASFLALKADVVRLAGVSRMTLRPEEAAEQRACDGRWRPLLETYKTVLAADNVYEAEHIRIPDDLPVGPERSAAVNAIPPEVWAESVRLQQLRFAAEDALMAFPSPDPAAFAFKVLLCRGGGRNLDGFDAVLTSEALAILGPDAAGLGGLA